MVQRKNMISTIEDQIEQNRQQLLNEQDREIRTNLLLKRIDLLKMQEIKNELEDVKK